MLSRWDWKGKMRRSKNVGSWDRRLMTAIKVSARSRQDTRTELEDRKKRKRKESSERSERLTDGRCLNETHLHLPGRQASYNKIPPPSRSHSRMAKQGKAQQPSARAQRTGRPQQHPTQSRNTKFWSSTGGADAYNIGSKPAASATDRAYPE